MKWCNLCHRHFPVDGFAKNRSKKDGLASICKSCHAIREKAWRQRQKTQPKPIISGDKWCNAGEHSVPVEGFSGNSTKKDGLQVRCKDCQKRYHTLNQVRIKTRGKQWRELNKEVISQKRKAAYWANHEVHLERRRQWYDKNKERHRQQRNQQAKESYRRHREKRLQRGRDHYYEHLEANRERGRAKARRPDLAAKRRTRDRHRYKTDAAFRAYYEVKAQKRRAAAGEFSRDQWITKCQYWGWRCHLCSSALTLATATIDHLIPISRGGSNWLANVAPACGFCNKSRRNLPVHEARRLTHERLGT